METIWALSFSVQNYPTLGELSLSEQRIRCVALFCIASIAALKYLMLAWISFDYFESLLLPQ